jgi:hypothetical protein
LKTGVCNGSYGITEIKCDNTKEVWNRSHGITKNKCSNTKAGIIAENVLSKRTAGRTVAYFINFIIKARLVTK